MTELTVHVHVHQDAVRVDPAPAAHPIAIEVDTSKVRDVILIEKQSLEEAMPPALEWSPNLCGGEHVSYADALEAVAKLGPEWRLPTRLEWCLAIDDTRYDPALDPEKHPGVKSGYHWTSTPCPWAPESAVFVVYADSGAVDSGGRGDECFVRAVRAVPGQ